ncbi:ABC transporter permease [Polynucleobacter kasalickyi]|uniref:Tungstate transport system permease protein n=1 Tax=Polynucleobacter kasalickyi TaxID=1938817 RepID=A0A1W1ZS71_9BURK|nr:ABC transporter permease [Polynucleobacter kasalickyi]SMC51299.1 tungstate transport system permease protein [Polynucleobacter kasalickyi]
MWEAFVQAATLLKQFDSEVWQIVAVSIQTSLTAVIFGTIIGLPIGGFLATNKFIGSHVLVTLLNSLMNVPTVIVGVCIYLLLSRSGPLGAFGLLFTMKGMIVAQSLITIPLIAAISRQIIADAWSQHSQTLQSFHLTRLLIIKWILWECRFSLVIALLAGFGRAISEVGAVMIVGGNIAHATRTMTTAISLETSKGDLPLALALGIVLMGLVLFINGIANFIKSAAERKYG